MRSSFLVVDEEAGRCWGRVCSAQPGVALRRNAARKSVSAQYDQDDMGARETKLDAGQFAMISKALADPRRFEMLQRIAASKDPPTCSRVRDWLRLAPATVSHHLRELESAGLVNIERGGKFAYISLRRDVLDAYVNRLSNL